VLAIDSRLSSLGGEAMRDEDSTCMLRYLLLPSELEERWVLAVDSEAIKAFPFCSDIAIFWSVEWRSAGPISGLTAPPWIPS
jgi:hypothetical protein